MDREPDAGASLRRRGAAYLLDAIVVSSVAEALADRLGERADQRLLTAALAGVLGTIYHVVLEGTTGRTLGKRLAGIGVVGEAGGPIGLRHAAIRTVLRGLDWLPVGYLLGIASIRRSSRGQRIGDRVAGTVVVRTDARVAVPDDHGGDDRTESRGSEVATRP